MCQCVDSVMCQCVDSEMCQCVDRDVSMRGQRGVNVCIVIRQFADTETRSD